MTRSQNIPGFRRRTGFGFVLGRERVARGMPRLAPVLATVSLLFGAWYALGAVEAVPYYF